jgi:hypothetical protein
MASSFLALLLFFLSSALHLDSKELSRRPHGIFPPALAPRLAVVDGLPLEGWGAAIEDEDGLDAEEEQLAYPTEEADNVAVPQRVALLVAHSFEELVYPDGRIDGEPLLVQRLDLDGSRAGLEDGPQAGDTHGGLRMKFSMGWRTELRGWLPL